MSLFVLDTDILTLYSLGHQAVYHQVNTHRSAHQVAVTIISVEEQLTGWYTQIRRARKRDVLASIYDRFTRTVEFLSRMNILSFTEPAIQRYEQLKSFKLNIGKADLCIAAITLENSGTQVTRNLRDFQRIPNLTIEDWSV